MQGDHIHVEIISYIYEQSTIFYQIQVKGNQRQWLISKRYSQFEELNKALEFNFKPLPPLPKKTFVSVFVGKTIEQINERKYGLQKYLQTLVARKEILETDILQQFLKIQPTEKIFKEELFKENIIEEVHLPTEDINQPLAIKNTIPKKIEFQKKVQEWKEQSTQTIEEFKEVINQINEEQAILKQQQEDELSSENQGENLQAQITELQQILNEKESNIQEFDKKVEETQQYYNQQIYEKQFQINELQSELSQMHQQQSQFQITNFEQQQQIEQLGQSEQINIELISKLQGQIHEQKLQLEKQQIQIGFVDRFGQLDLTQEQQLIIDQQNMIEIQMEKNNENEAQMRIELEKHYQVESQRDELFEENNHLKESLAEEMMQKQQIQDELEQLKVQNEYLQMQLKDKQEIIEIRDQLNEHY